MPIRNRPAFLSLNPPTAFVSNAAVSIQSAQKHLYLHLDSLRLQIRSEPVPDFREAPHAPDYCAMRRSGFFEQHNNFTLNNSGEDVFMHARREPDQCAGAFDGDKFHISVKREEVPKAFNALSGLLFSEDSPIDKWKVTDVERAQAACRVSEGAQLTLYLKPESASSQYTAKGLNRIRYFVERLESILAEHNIQPGHHPDSDIRPTSWQYASYRNELRSQREGSEMQSQALRNEPFYRLVTE